MEGSRESEPKEGTLVFHFLRGYELIQSIGQELKGKEITEATQPLRRKEGG